MIKSSSKNGITVEKDIELVMKNTGFTPWYYYLLQLLLLGGVCSSVCSCFFSGLSISINYKIVIVVMFAYAALFMALYSFRGIFKYLGLITMFIYVMIGYINLERMQEGFARIYNEIIKLYNVYFDNNLGLVNISKSEYKNTELFFALFIMFIVAAVICYSAMFGRTMFFYIIVTIPVVFLSFLVGYTPDMWPYITYVAGTIAIFAGVISERYGLFAKVNRTKWNNQTVTMLVKTRVRVQTYCAIVMLLLFSIVYVWYSPERYQKEFNASEVKNDIQNKVRELTSSDLLKDSIFNKMLNKETVGANSGLSNGKLGDVSSLRYANKTALLVTAYNTKNNRDLYLKGYVGESYEGDRWTALSGEDERKIEKINLDLNTASDVEHLPQSFVERFRPDIFGYYPIHQLTMGVENISADRSCEYIPYFSDCNYELDNGKIKSDQAGYSYYRFTIPESEEGLTYNEMFYKYCKIPSILQLNAMNRGILEKYLGHKLSEEDIYAASEYENMNNWDSIGSYPLSQFDKSISAAHDTNVKIFSTQSLDLTSLEEETINLGQYSADENQYFNAVKEIYTKLPDTGVEKVKELVKDKKVDLMSVNTQNADYETMDQVDTTGYARKIYEKYRQVTDISSDELYSSKFTYDELMNQDKIFDALMYVKNYLAENTSYTLSPGKTPSGKDYVEYFLFENKKGYCMHYASAATVMLRAMGIPARYAEGYIVTQDDLDKGEVIESGPADGNNSLEGNYVRMDIKDTNAHAWVEVYLPGFGWTPIEMTAPYSANSQVEIPPVNANPSATLKPTVKPTQPANATASPTASATASSSPKATDKSSGQSNMSTSGPSITNRIGDWYNGLSNSVKRIISIVIGIIIFLWIMVIVIMIRRALIIEFHKRKWARYGMNERVLYQYELLHAFTKHNIPAYKTGEPYERYVSEFVHKYPFVSEDDASVFFSILLKAKFGMSVMTQEELNEIVSFYISFVSTIYQNSSKMKKWYYKYIYVIR